MESASWRTPPGIGVAYNEVTLPPTMITVPLAQDSLKLSPEDRSTAVPATVTKLDLGVSAIGKGWKASSSRGGLMTTAADSCSSVNVGDELGVVPI